MKTGEPGEKPLGAEQRTSNKLNSHMTLGPRKLNLEHIVPTLLLNWYINGNFKIVSLCLIRFGNTLQRKINNVLVQMCLFTKPNCFFDLNLHWIVFSLGYAEDLWLHLSMFVEYRHTKGIFGS